MGTRWVWEMGGAGTRRREGQEKRNGTERYRSEWMMTKTFLEQNGVWEHKCRHGKGRDPVSREGAGIPTRDGATWCDCGGRLGGTCPWADARV